MMERIERMVCDVCSATGPEVRDGESARQAADAEGRIVREGQDLCPRCKYRTITEKE